jgi:alkanesulfonate monooxygenase SsuD/methylene tetrahydromethanopterin reductase-like flavin-dependent oxidoreductase (luciferase family)
VPDGIPPPGGPTAPVPPDFATIEDSLAIQSTRRWVPDDRVDQVRGRLDAVMVAARVGPATSRIGFVPVATTTHTEPFHVSKAIATLDYVTAGRAGVQVRVSPSSFEADQFGRRRIPERVPGASVDLDIDTVIVGLFDEAADFVEVLRRLWDSWEDDAEIRDVATGRFVDRDRLHTIDFAGRWFEVRGPSITPRPPQGQPVVAALAHVPEAFELAARSADLVFVTPGDTDDVAELVGAVRRAEESVGRRGEQLRIFADLVVFLDEEPGVARARLDALDALDGRPMRSDAALFAGTPAELADRLEEWTVAGIDAFRVRPGVLPHDLGVVTDALVPVLQRRGLFRTAYGETTLRARLGLERPANRFVTAGTGS